MFSNTWELLGDLTLPIISYFTGARVNLLLQNIFRDETTGEAVQIEDLWIRYFCVTTNMSTFYGNIKFSSAGNNIAKPMVLRQIQNGKLNVVAPSKWASHAVQYPRKVKY